MERDGGEFAGFGDSILVDSVRRPLRQFALARELAKSRRLVREHIPDGPGVYGWLDREQRLVYVGKSKSLRARLQGYFLREPNDPKMARIRQASTRLIWEPISHELLALIREQELIFRWRPLFNRQGQPQRRKPGFVCVTGGSAPRIVMSHRRLPLATACFGPILGTGQLRAAVDCLNYAFGLRDCAERVRMHMTSQLPLLEDLRSAQCLRYELQSCLGPCAGGCTPHAYQAAVNAALQFLRGEDRERLNRLESEIADAIQRLAFERAAVLHSQYAALLWLWKRLAHWRSARGQIDGAFPVPTFAGRAVHVILREGTLVGYATHPRARSVTLPRSLKKLEREDDALEMEIFLIISSWFRKNRDQLLRIQPRAQRNEPAAKSTSVSPGVDTAPLRETA